MYVSDHNRIKIETNKRIRYLGNLQILGNSTLLNNLLVK